MHYDQAREPSLLPSLIASPFLLTLLCYYITFSLFKVIFKFIYIFDHILPLPQALPDPLPTHPTLSLFSKNIKTQYNNNIPPPKPQENNDKIRPNKSTHKKTVESIPCWPTTPEHKACPRVVDIPSVTLLENCLFFS